jgi:hypothetical protein
VAWLFPEDVNGWFTYSIVDMMRWDAQGPRHMVQEDGGFITLSTGPRIAEARNQLVDIFAEKHRKAEWLLMLDSDMTFHPSLLETLIAAADPVERPIVGGLCFAGGKMNDPYPTVYKAIQVEDGDTSYANIERVYDYPRNAMVRVGATGGACLLMHRQALAAIGEKHRSLPNGLQNPYPWFAEGVVGPKGEPWGEDIVFCLRALQLGIPVYVHTGVQLGHRKTHTIDEVYYDNHRRAVELTKQGAFDAQTPANGRAPGPVNEVAGGVPQSNRAHRRAAARKKASR